MSQRERKSGKYSKSARPVVRLPHRKILEDGSDRGCICCSNGSSQSIFKRAQMLRSFSFTSSWGSQSSDEGGSGGLTASQEDEEKEEGDFRRELRTSLHGQSSTSSSRQASSSFNSGISAAVGKIRAKIQGVKSRMSTNRAMGDNSQRPSRAVPAPGFFPTSTMKSSSWISSSLASSSSTTRAKSTATTAKEATATTVGQENEGGGEVQSTSCSDLESHHGEDSGSFGREISSSSSSGMHWTLCDGAVGKVGRESIDDFNQGADKPSTRAGSTGSTGSLFGRTRTAERTLTSKVNSPYDFSTSGSGGDLWNADCLEDVVVVVGGRGMTATDPPAGEPPLRCRDRLRNSEASSLPGDTSDILPALTECVRSMGSIPEESNLQLHSQQGQAEVATFCGKSLSASGAGSAVVACEAQFEINRLDRELVKLKKEMDKLLSQEDQIFADQIRRCFR